MNDKLHNLRHSLAHLLAAAVIELWPGTKRAIGPAIDNGFYYDFEFASPISDTDLPKIEKEMRKILKSWSSFERKEISADEARELFKDNPYKLELIDEYADQGLTIYTSGNFTDLCRGGHVDDAKDINPDAFTLTHLAGAYWRGDEKNNMLTRIYGLAFETKEELEHYVAQLEEAKKRDHKKVGVELDLFTFSELVGAGLPLWTPKGTLVRNLLDDYVWQLRKAQGYEKVEIPHITKKDLYERSGHWEKFENELFKIKTREDHLFAMKPMNCPHHTQIYARKQFSYRDLPQRYANTTMVYRDEQSGELAGLSRVRSITQDDAHIFCQKSSIKEEISNVWNIIETFYGTFGLPLKLRLSLHDPKHPENYLGSHDEWLKMESELREIAQSHNIEFTEAEGEAAFYGPKLDFTSQDSLGRIWQVATVQLDMNMPERFDLTCINDQGQKERIIMIHAAIMGSIERFMSLLIEHTAGSFATWLAPVQVAILAIGEKHHAYALELMKQLQQHDIRVMLDIDSTTIGKKIRNAEMQKIPYLAIIGDKEIEARAVAIRKRGEGDKGQVPITQFVSDLLQEISEKK